MRIVWRSFGLVGLACCLAVPVSAENRLGVVVGVNFADLDTNDDPNVTTLTRPAIGAVIDIGFGEHLDLRLEPMYLQKGGELEPGANPSSDPGGRLSSSFLELPVLLKISVGERVAPYLLVGPTIGLRLGADLEADVAGLTLSADMKGVTEPIDLGVAFGAGVSFPVGPASGFLECRYSIGLSNRIKGGRVTAEGPIPVVLEFEKVENEYKNKGLQILAGVTFRLGSS
jgi:hypothetical protein